MSDREALNQALLLHLWWPHSEVSLRAGDKGGDICTLYEELRTFRGAGVLRTTPNYLRRQLRNVEPATVYLCFCIIYPLVLKGEYLPKPCILRPSLHVEYTCCKMIRRPKRCRCVRLIIEVWWVTHCESFYIRCPPPQPWSWRLMAIAPDSLSLHHAQSILL
jgi:hypothetical protein